MYLGNYNANDANKMNFLSAIPRVQKKQKRTESMSAIP